MSLSAAYDRKDPTQPRFHWLAKPDPDATKAAGAPRYRNVPMVEIVIPGDNRTRIVREVQDKDRERWPDQWERFSGGAVMQIEGTPLSEWPQITVAQVEDMRQQNVLTVEQLANVADHLLPRLGMGARDLQNKARIWLGIAADQGKAVETITAQGKQIADLSRRNSDLESMIQGLALQIEQLRSAQSGTAPMDIDGVLDGNEGVALQPAPRRGPGRPRKPAAEDHEAA